MPTYESDAFAHVPVLDHVETLRDDGREAVCYAVNRSQTDTLTLVWELEHLHPVGIEAFTVLTAPDRTITNRSHPRAIWPQAGSGAKLEKTTCTLPVPPLSFVMVRVALQG